jgi:arylsulfatase A-like enzyme
VRYGDWKLLYFYEDQDYELYNLKSNPGENEEVSDQYPEKAEELKAMIDNWLEETKAPIPSQKNPDFDSTWNREQIEKFLNKKP